MEPDIKDAAEESPPTSGERITARAKQVSAEARWRPEDAEWAEHAVAEHADVLFQAIFERAALGIALVDLEGRVARANPALSSMLGRDDLAGRAFTDIAHPEDAALDQRMFEQLVAQEFPHYAIEKRYRRADGSTLWGRMTASLIVDADGLPEFVIGVVEDVSERVGSERAAAEQHRMMRDAYAHVIAAVTGGQLLLLGPDEFEASLGDSILPPSAIREPKDVSRTRAALREELDRRAVSAECAERLVLAASEATTNALKHGGHGTVELHDEDGVLQVVVRDEGPGIHFEDLPKLALVPGESTAVSLGMGFTIMLANCERVALSTGETGTAVLAECQCVSAP
jgi:PAS domain S-box-containing protein